jgi:hypothetical protein
MFARMIATGALALGLIATDAATVTDSAEARMFKGRTAQGYRIELAVRDGKFKILKFEADLRCRDGSVLTLIESGFLWTPVRGNGSFRDAQFGRTDSVYFRGKLGQRRLRGRVRLTDELQRGKLKCRSRWISFNARGR